MQLQRTYFEVFRYLLVGISTVILDFLTLIFFKEIILLSAVQAVLVNQLLVFGYNFSLNKYWSFKNYSLPYVQFFRYLLAGGCNYIFSIGTMYIFTTLLHYDYRLVRLVAIMIAAGVNFILYKHWIYVD